MSSILSGFAESWRDAVRDVVLIVLSIVIAFAVDAWWDDRGEARLEQRHIASLLSEFRATQAELTAQLHTVERSRDASAQILMLTGGPSGEVSPDSLTRLIVSSFNVGAPALEGGALRALLASGGFALLSDPRLTSSLAEWPLVVERIHSDAELLVRNREEEITDYLVEAGAPIARIAQDIPWLELPETLAELDADHLLTDVAFQSLFVSRRIRTQFLHDTYVDALDRVDEILGLLESDLDS